MNLLTRLDDAPERRACPAIAPAVMADDVVEELAWWARAELPQRRAIANGLIQRAERLAAANADVRPRRCDRRPLRP